MFKFSCNVGVFMPCMGVNETLLMRRYLLYQLLSFSEMAVQGNLSWSSFLALSNFKLDTLVNSQLAFFWSENLVLEIDLKLWNCRDIGLILLGSS